MKRINWKYSFLLGASMLAGVYLSAYVVSTRPEGNMPTWDESRYPIEIRMWEGFTDELDHVVDGSGPRLVIAEALERWTKVSSIVLNLGEDTATPDVGLGDSINVITAADTPVNRSVLGVALGVSLRRSIGNQIVEADIALNPDKTWSTIESTERSIDNLLDVVLHELGHNWFLGHTILRDASMYFQGGAFGFAFNSLSWDDIAGINVGYPLPGLDQITGSIFGRVTMDGDPVFGAFVVAVDEYGVVAASAITLTDGAYALHFLPKGTYTLYVEPLDGPMTPKNVTGGIFSDTPMVTDFLPAFYDGSQEPTVAVDADVAGIDFNVVPGNAVVDPLFVGTDSDTMGSSLTSLNVTAFPGIDTNVVVRGNGVGSVLPGQGMFFLGADLSAGSIVGIAGTGSTATKWFPVSIAQEAVKGTRSVFLQTSEEFGVMSGALQLFDILRFGEVFAQFANLPDASTSEFFLINTDLGRHADGRISLRDETGSRQPANLLSLARDPQGDYPFGLSAGGSLQVRSSDGASFVGSLRARAGASIGGAVLFEGPFGTTGVGASEPLHYFVAPVEIKGGGATNTGLAITNMDDRPVQIFVQVQGKNGLPLRSNTIELQGNGHIARFVREKNDLQSLVPGIPADFEGSVLATANRPIAATVIRLAPGAFTTFPVVQNRIATRSFYAQFAHFGDLTSVLLLVNPSPISTAQAQIQVRDSSGTEAAVTLGGEFLAKGQKNVSIAPLGCVILATGGLQTVLGSVEVSSRIPVGGVVLFESPLVGTAGVGESAPLREVVVPLTRDVEAGIDTGIAAANTEDHPLTLIVTVRNGSGSAVRGPIEVKLMPRQQRSQFPNQDWLNLNLPKSFTGSLWIQVQDPTGAVAFTVIRQSPGVLTTFPAIATAKPLTPAG